MKDDGDSWFEEKICPVCGKQFTVLYPRLWTYKSGKQNHNLRYFCTYTCQRTDERTGDSLKRLLSKEEILDICIAAIREGKHPYDVLKETGYKNPAQTYASARHWARDHKNEKINQLPENLQKWMREKKTAGKQKAEPAKEPEKAEEPEKVEIVEDGTEREEEKAELKRILAGRIQEKVITGPETVNGMKIREVEGQYGRYRYTVDYGSNVIVFESLEGEKVTMRPWEWTEFWKEMRKASAVLGVGVDET